MSAKGTTYVSKIAKAIVALKTRGGSSRQAITKFLEEAGDVNKVALKKAFRDGVAKGLLIQPEGKQTFRLSDEARKAATRKGPAKKKAAAPKKPAKRTKSKSAAPKKKAKKPAAKKKK